MSKKLLFVALATTACAISAFGCSKSAEEAPPPLGAADMADASFVPTAPALGTEGGTLPILHLDDAGAPTPSPASGDAGASADGAPVEVDPGAAMGARVWGTDGDGRLVSFRVGAPDKVSVRSLTGLASGEKIVSVSFRPATGALYGLSNTSHLYVVTPLTGVASVVGPGTAFAPALMGQAQGFDFNPVADKIRVHTDVDEDLRLDPVTGAVAGVDGTLMFAPGDVNGGQNPNLVATSYTNSVTPAPSSTMLYAIDSTRNLLTRLPDPNTGMVETIGDLGVDVDPAAGFDISRLGIAYAALHVGTETALYTIDLTNGMATKVAAIGYPAALTSIAVEP